MLLDGREQPAMTTSSTFGDFLRYYRLRAGITQEELAKKAAVSVRGIRDVERGRAQTPRRRTVELLATALSLSEQDAETLIRSLDGRPTDADAGRRVHHMPAAPEDFVGRDADLGWVRDFARETSHQGRTDILVLFGSPGAGKTALALRIGNLLGEHFADGCLYLDLRGADPQPMPPAEAIHAVLHMLGVRAEEIPASPSRCLEMYRSMLSSHSLLLVLDNPADEEQVRPLLCSSPGSMLLITTRNALVGLEVTARRELPLLEPAASVDLLAAVTGRAMVEEEPGAAARVVELCGGMPLALRIAGERLSVEPGWTMGRLAAELEDERRRLETLHVGESQVRAAFDLSYRLLAPDAARLFRRLSTLPGVDAGVDVAAAIADLPVYEAEPLLEHLVDVSLLATASVPGRYGCHDLLRLYAAQRLEVDEGAAASGDIRAFASSWLLRRAGDAALNYYPDEVDLPARTGFENWGVAGEWLAAELTNWRGAFRRAVEEGDHRAVVDLSRAMHWYSDSRGTPALWLEVYSAGAAAAQALEDPREIATHLNFLSWTLSTLVGKVDEALDAGDRALAAAREAGDLVQEGWAQLYRSIALAMTDPTSSIDPAWASVECFAKAGFTTGEHIAMGAVGGRLHEAGRNHESVEVLRKAIELHERQRHTNVGAAVENRAFMWITLGDALMQQGRLQEASRALDEAENLLAPSAMGMRTWVRFRRAALLVAMDDRQGAAKYLIEVLESADGRRVARRALAMLAGLADELGDRELAIASRVRALAMYREYDLAEVLNSAELTALLASESSPAGSWSPS